MPFIEENDLLDLHKDIEKAQIINERLLDQIKFKNNDLKKLKVRTYVMLGLLGIILIGSLGMFAYLSGASNSKKEFEGVTADSNERVDSLEMEVGYLRQQLSDMRELDDYYLARKLMEKEVVYSVQVKSLVENNATLASNAITNTKFVRNNKYFAYSIGNFETLEEAQAMRRELVDIGFKDAFVARYREGRRISIERPD